MNARQYVSRQVNQLIVLMKGQFAQLNCSRRVALPGACPDLYGPIVTQHSAQSA